MRFTVEFIHYDRDDDMEFEVVEGNFISFPRKEQIDEILKGKRIKEVKTGSFYVSLVLED